uniref:Anosmin 1 n=1 Tax=Mastacembelus armatus TaxID=205130 RepID=A0A7N8XX08_9TELE
MKRKSNCRELCEISLQFSGLLYECIISFVHLPPTYLAGVSQEALGVCDELRVPSVGAGGEAGQLPPAGEGQWFCGGLLSQRPLQGKELGFEELSSGQLEVRWSSRFNVSAEPVVYVLQRRWNYGIQPSEDTATSWEVVAQSTEQAARLHDIRPGRWYQFRVAAVNTHGTRGFTTPSRHIHSSRDPSSPPAPTELRVANISFGPGRAVSTTIRWSMSADLDVPVHHYKVTWSWTAAGQTSASSLTKRRRMVRESQVELDSMRSNRSYTVEVQAISYWEQTQLKGPRAVLHFTTQRSTAAASRNPAGDVLDVGTPFYQDGQLRVHVYWEASTDPSLEFYRIQWGPEYCGHNQTRPTEKISTKESFVSLQGLLFSCKYRVLLQPISKKSRPLAERTTFFTPSCATIQSKSPKPIPCSGETAVPPQKTPTKAANLTASFKVWGGNVTAIFSWDLSKPPPLSLLTGYQVTWVEVIPTNRHSNNKLPPSLISQSQILPPDGNVLVVAGLHPASLYRLEVQVITAEAVGPATSRTFQTPGLRKQHHKQPITERQ